MNITTTNEPRLLDSGFVRKNIPGVGDKIKNGFYYEKQITPTTTVVYLTQGGLKVYFKHFFGKEMCRCPDEAYLFKHGCDGDASYTLKILEKKNQNTSGSVDTKLLAGKGFIDEYIYCLGGDGDGDSDSAPFTVEYAFCINEFLKKDYIADTKKSEALRFIHKKDGISVLFGDDTDYFDTLDAWLFGG